VIVIRFVGVGRRFGDVVALQPTDLAFEARRSTVLLGPSGGGKSTILRLIAGVIQPTRGWIEFEGRRVTPASIGFLRRRLGYVIQDGGLFPHLTAAGNVALMARYLGWQPARIDGRLSDLCDLTHFPRSALGRYPAELSGGQRQRVGLMRALMLDPDVLLLDEPLGALDPMVRSELQQELRDIFERLGRTVIFVTHDLAEAAFLSDRIVLLAEGRVVQDGTLPDLRDHPASPFVTAFLTAQRRLTR
jgi:osmoprotectant transport system ATP-binding protein